jgi:DNA replication and repair protein RecF
MRLLSLSLRDFRNYEEADLEFAPGLNLFYGDNAQGKSNLLEAIYFAITGRSFRTANLTDLIREGAQRLFIELTFQKGGIVQTLRIGFDGSERRILHNQTRLTALADLLGLLQGVLLCPEDRQLIDGAPAFRRRFLDLHLAQLDPLYVRHLSRYHRAVKQRNHLLRSGAESSLTVWEEQLARSGSYIAQQRQQATKELAPLSQQAHQELAEGKEQITLHYRTTADCEESFLSAFERLRKREQLLGYTTVGPHRDDLEVTLNGRDARLFGSEGQKACCAMSLRLSEWQRLYQKAGERPLLLIDDITASLDATRKAALNAHLTEVGQTFLALPHFLETEGKAFCIQAGRVLSGEMELL